jgi:hypothetical protein
VIHAEQFRPHLDNMKRTYGIFCALIAGMVVIPPCRCAQTSTTAWSIAVLDQILTSIQPGQTTVRIDDMEILVSNLQAWRNQLAGLPSPKSAFYGTASTWPGGNVYYTFDPSVSAAQQKVFLDSAAEWALFANLHFIARTTQPNYVTIVETNSLDAGKTPLEGGVSDVGMISGQQFIWFSSNAWNHGIICHEIGHTLGLAHEHQRSDRDAYLSIITNNVAPNGWAGLVKLSGTRNMGPYDFLSVMHYAQWAGSVDPPTLPTMVPLPPYSQFANIMGQGDPKLTPYDRAGMALMYGPASPLTNVVSNTQDSGPGSLRAALYYAYDNPGTTVRFNIPTTNPGFSNGAFNIQPTDVLPSLFNATVLDGSTEPANTNVSGPSILLSGVLANTPAVSGTCLRVRGTNCVVRGLIVTGFNGSGISLYGGATSNLVGGYSAAARNVISGNMWSGISLSDNNSTGNVIAGNYIGLNAAGTAVVSNGFVGIELDNGTSQNTIGGTAPGAGNVISGNAGGVLIRNAGSSANLVQGNLIGVSPSGLAAMPNSGSGINLYGGVQSNLIGGYTASARNVISGNSWSGISVSDSNSTGNVIAGNYIGLNAAGTAAVPNSFVGIELDNGTSQNTIGGTAPGARNVISGNSGSAVLIRFAGSSDNTVAGNLIGLNADGDAPIPNGQGISLYGGAQFNLIGGYTAAARNVISGNGWSGVALSDSNTVGNVVTGNYIGLNAAGSAAVPNAFAGVEVNSGTAGNVIGGATIGSGNVISGNDNAGILIRFAGTSGNTVQGNIIGLNGSATAPLANAGSGINLYGGAQSNLIGGLAVGNANLISGNVDGGVSLSDAATTGNAVRGNSIYANGGMGIVLYNSANGSIPSPTLLSATLGLNTMITGLLTGIPNTTYHADFYANPPPSGDLEGMTYLGARDITTGALGTASFSVVLNARIPAGCVVTATITDSFGNTSSFSGGVLVTTVSTVKDGIPDAWRAQYFGGSGTTTNSQSCAACDPDHDGMNNLQEFLAGTNPTNAASVLRLNDLPASNGGDVVSFLSAAGIVYRLLSRDDLASGFWSIAADQIVGTGTNIFIPDPSTGLTPKRFFRLQLLW